MIPVIDTVWITGASSGIGRSLALQYAQQGCKVFASARNTTALAALATETADSLGSIEPAPLDVTDTTAVAALVKRFEDNSTVPDLCILNAGFYEVVAFDNLSTDHFSDTFSVNYMGVTNCMLSLLPALKQRCAGQIAVVSSVAGYAGLPNAAAYGSSKAALINLCESLKHDFDNAGLKLSLVNPGFVKTPMTDKNSFAMPFTISSEEAAKRIVKGLASPAFEVTFPKRFTWMVKLLRLLPYRLFFKITRRMT